jgi:hypothetical protein
VTIIMFTIGIALVVGVIVPLSDHVMSTGERAYQQGSQVAEDLEDVLE